MKVLHITSQDGSSIEKDIEQLPDGEYLVKDFPHRMFGGRPRVDKQKLEGWIIQWDYQNPVVLGPAEFKYLGGKVAA